MADAGLIVMVSFMSPFRPEHRLARKCLSRANLSRSFRYSVG
ncbi:hypothetical protein [Heliomicrobium gestii]|nr:hypothetical protein [Heliomicrobium gestii]